MTTSPNRLFFEVYCIFDEWLLLKPTEEQQWVVLNYSILINEDNRLIINIKCIDKSYQLNLSKDNREPDIMIMKSRISAELQKSMNLNQSFIVAPFLDNMSV